MSAARPRFPIVMKTWAGPEAHDFAYISRSLPSLLASELPEGAEVVIFDDASTDPRLWPFLESIAQADGRVRLFRNDSNKGPNRGQADAYAAVVAEYPDAPFYVNVDDDVVYHPGWLQRLIQARDDVLPHGHDGVYSALNMPFRPTHTELRTPRASYLLKWKQPALNWLIPREVYERVGPFEDDGIAYDTVYSHWMRLHGLSVVCLRPSRVQNVGTYGAYSRDETTTAADFLGDGPLTRLRHRMRAVRRRLGEAFAPGPYRILWPIRWGSEWVYEAVARDGAPVAISPTGGARFGDDPERLLRRATEVQRAQASGPLAIRAVHRSREGRPVAVECGWRFWPNLRECARLPGLRERIDSGRVFRALVKALIPLHRAGLVHNKIRAENVYFDSGEERLHLAWFGTEPDPGGENSQVEDGRCGAALDRRASADLGRRFADRYVEAIAPEVRDGCTPTPASDLYAAAFVAGDAGENARWEGPIEEARRRALSRDPSGRPKDAVALASLLESGESV